MIELEGSFSAVKAVIVDGKEGKVKQFRSKSPSGSLCAPYVIVNAARKRVIGGAALEMPEGRNEADLVLVGWKTKTSGNDVLLPSDIVHDLKLLGSQVLSLNSRGLIQPPLTPVEATYIEQLIDVVSAAEQEVAVTG